METILLNFVKNMIASKFTELTANQAENIMNQTMSSKEVQAIDKKVEAMKDNAHKSLKDLIWG